MNSDLNNISKNYQLNLPQFSLPQLSLPQQASFSQQASSPISAANLLLGLNAGGASQAVVNSSSLPFTTAAGQTNDLPVISLLTNCVMGLVQTVQSMVSQFLPALLGNSANAGSSNTAAAAKKEGHWYDGLLDMGATILSNALPGIGGLVGKGVSKLISKASSWF